MSLNKLKWAAILCFVVAMVVLLWGGVAMKKELPPYPGKVVGPQVASFITTWTIFKRESWMSKPNTK